MKRPLDTTLEVETQEHIAFRYQLAGPAQRAVAYFIDLLIRGAVLLVFALLLMAFSGKESISEGIGMGAYLVLFFLMEWGYFVFFEYLRAGQSPGKRAMKLRVVHQNGRPASLGDSVLRNFLRAADLLPTFYGVGLATMIFDHRFRRLGDMVAQTIVIAEPTVKRLKVTQKVHSLDVEGLPARPLLSVEERDAIALFCRRRETLSEARALELATMLAPALIHRFRLENVGPIELLEALHQRGAGQ
jgi:uncharacterized RDD family membrane protein YckC